MRFLILCLFVVTGCMVGPNYRRPCVSIPDGFRFDTGKKKEDTLGTAWWKDFNDPVLEALVAEALAYNNTVKAATARIQQAIGLLIQIRAPLFPQIGYDAFVHRERLSRTLATPLPRTVPNPQTTIQATVNASWQLDFFGRIQRQVESATANVLASVETERDIVLTLVASVVNAYIALRGLDEQLEIAKKTFKSYEEALIYFKTQYQYGQTSQLSVAQASTQYELAASKIPQIEFQIAQTENALSVLLGRNPTGIPRGKAISELTMPAIPEGLPSEILEQRPDVKRAEFAIVAANADIGAAKALYFPSITLTGQYGAASSSLSHLFSGPSRIWSYTADITGPIFTAGAIYGQVLQAEGATYAAIAEYRNTIEQAFSEVADAFAGRTLLQEQLAAQGRLVEAAGEYVRLSQLQYNGGYSPYFVVLQAQQQLFPSELSWVETRVTLFQAAVNIYRALGGGWVTIATQQLDCQ